MPVGKVDTRIIGTIAAIVPYHPKGRPWTLQSRKVAINVGQKPRDAERFAAAIAASFRTFMKREAARPKGDGLVLTGLEGSKRGKGKPDLDWKGKRVPSMRVDRLPASPLHRHSKRCLRGSLKESTISRPGWWWCTKIGYPGLPLHEHRTKRGRVFLVAHLNDAMQPPCPFDVA